MPETVLEDNDKIDKFMQKFSTMETDKEIPGEKLTPREKEILKLILNGYNNNEMAEKLCRGKETVRTHRHHIYDKFGVHFLA
jgi:DNA-binding NarL/FixJ family response regulator